MSRGLFLFDVHPWTFEQARTAGLQRGIVTHVVDGDTYDVLVDDGRHQYSVLNVRLRGVDTPELYTSDPVERARGIAARDFVAAVFLEHQMFVLLATFKDAQTFGRWVADVYLAGRLPAPELLSVGQVLRDAGYGPRIGRYLAAGDV